MPLIITRSPRTRQPQGAVRSSGGHWSGQGLVAALPGNGLFYDAAGLRAAVPSGAPAFTTVHHHRFGAAQAINFDGANDQISFGVLPLLTTFSMLAWVRPVATDINGYRAAISSGDVFGTNANFIFGVRLQDASSPRLFCFARNGGALLGKEITATYLANDVWSRIGVSWRNGAQAYYIDGLQVDTSSSGDPVHDGSPLIFGGKADSVNNVWCNVPAHDMRLYSRVLSPAEFADDYAAPWRMFAPLERRIWVPSASSAVPTITAVSAENITATSADYRVTLDFA